MQLKWKKIEQRTEQILFVKLQAPNSFIIYDLHLNILSENKGKDHCFHNFKTAFKKTLLRYWIQFRLILKTIRAEK